MKVKSLYGQGKTVFSFEVFPPKKTTPIESIYATLDKLTALKPNYISVTYGAGGNLADKSTIELASTIKNKYGVESMAHLTCVNSSRDDVLVLLDEMKKNNIENILALRGDIKPDIEPKHDFRYANELIEFIRANGDFDVSAACYPECHVDADNLIDDIRHLKNKVDTGVSELISQLFFDNGCFYDFMERIRIAGINVPVTAGIMPVTSKNQIERMVTMCGASLPQKFVRMIQKYESKPEALVDAGIAYAVDQIVDLISNGVEGIHLYTMNNPYVAEKIAASVRSLL